MFINAIEELLYEVVSWFYQEIQTRIFAFTLENNDKRITLQEQSQINKWNSNINILFNLNFSWSRSKDCHSHNIILSCNQSLKAVTIKSDVFI